MVVLKPSHKGLLSRLDLVAGVVNIRDQAQNEIKSYYDFLSVRRAWTPISVEEGSQYMSSRDTLER